MPIQVAGTSRHRKGTLLAILARQLYGTVEGNSIASALRDLTALDSYSGHYIYRGESRSEEQ